MNPFAAELGGLVPAPRAAEDFSADLAPLVPKPRTGIDALLGRANDFARDLATVPSREEAGAARLAAADALNPNAPQARGFDSGDVSRSWGEFADDQRRRLMAGLDTGAAAIAEVPVNLLNAANRGADMMPGSPTGLARDVMRLLGYEVPVAVPQPELVRNYAARKRAEAEMERGNTSFAAGVRRAEMGEQSTALDMLKFVAANPGMLADESSEVVGQMASSMVPGAGVGVNIIGPALQAGSMNAAQVREALRAQGVTDDAEIERRASDAFAESTALNALLPKLVPGGSAVERLLAGEAAQPGIGAAARVLAPTVGEAVSEGASGGGDQIITNVATGRPLTEGVGSATALEALLGGGMGAGVGAVDAARAAPVDAAIRADEAAHSDALAALAQDRAAAALDPNRVDFSAPLDGAIQPSPVATPAERAAQFMADLRAAAPLPAAPTPNAAAPAPEPSARLRPDQSGAAATNPQPAPAAAAPATTSAPEGVPVMITRGMKDQLRAKGATDAEIAAMTPAQAWERINAPPAQATATPAPQPTAPATAAPLTASAPAAPGPTPRTGRSIDPDARARREFEGNIPKYQAAGMTPEQVEVVRGLHPLPTRDEVTGLHRNEQLNPTIEAARTEAEATGTPAHYAQVDVQRLGGLNEFMGGTDAANPHFKAVVDILGQEVRAAGGEAALVREGGGDEFGVVTTGISTPDLTAALDRARAKVAEYAKANGLENLPGKKDQGPGPLGLHYGISEITPGAAVEDVRKVASSLTQRRKKGAPYELAATPEMARPGSDAGRPVTGGIGADRAGIARADAAGEGEVRAGPPAAAPAAPEGVARAAPVAEPTAAAPEPTPPTPTEAAPAVPVEGSSASAPAGAAPAAETPAPATTEPVAAEPAPAAPPERPATSTKNAVVDAERKKRGAEAIVSDLEVSNQETVDAARKAVEERPELGAELVQRILNDGTAGVSLQDEAVLLVEKVRLMNARDAAADRMADESATPEARAVAAEEWAQHEAAIAMMDKATRATGAEWGRLGQFRQRLLRMDYSLEAMERKARAAKGVPLTAEEAAEVSETHEALQRREKIAERTQAAVEDAEVATTYEALFKALHAEFRAPGKLTLMERLEKRANEARARLEAMPEVKQRGKQSGAIAITPQALVDLTTIGAWNIAKGAATFAEWVAAMKQSISEKLFGEVEPQLPKIHEASLKLHERAGAPRKAAKAELTSRDDLTQDTIYKLAQAQVEAGVRGPEAVMKAVHAQVAAKFPDVTERDVRRLFVNYGKTKFPSKDAVKTELRELRTLVRLQESIDREREGLAALKTGQQRDKATQAVRELQAQLNDMLKRRVDAGGLDEDALATYNTARATALRNQIADLEKEIATGEKRQRAKPAEPNEEVKALIAQRDALRKQLDAIERARRPQKSPEQRYNDTLAKVLQKRTEELKRKIANKDFAPKVRQPPPELSEANKKAQFEFWHTRAEFQNRLADWEAANWPVWKKALSGVRNGVNLARASMTSLDLSSTLKQGGFIGAGAPIRLIRSIFAGGRAAISEAEAHARQQALLQRPNAPLYAKHGLYLADDYNHDLTKAEEGFQSNWIRKLPLKEGEPFLNALRRAKNVGSAHIRASNRYFNTQLNQLRADTFDALVATLGNRTTMTPERYKAIADYVNFATGRGKLGVGDQAASNLGTVFFAPRWVSSLFAMVLGYPAWTTDRHVARLVLEQYAKFAAGTLVVLALGALAKAGSGDDTPLTSADPRSPEFGKMRFGRTRVDFLRGMGTVIQFMAREAMGETIDSKGRVQPLREGLKPANLFRDHPDTRAPRYGATDAASLAGKFLRQKLAPVPATAFNLASGKNVNGMPVTPAGEAGRMLAPMTAMDVYTLLKNDGFPQGAAESVATILGMSAQYYDPNAWDEAKAKK